MGGSYFFRGERGIRPPGPVTVKIILHETSAFNPKSKKPPNLST